MSEIDLTELEARLDPRDREYVAGLGDAEKRSTVASTIVRYRRKETLAVGDALPPLDLFRLEDGKPVALAALLEHRPLVLVFGSFTWPPFRRRSGDVESLYETFRDRASFAFVYIAEAHAIDEWQMESNEQEGVLLYQHTTIAERFAAAREGVMRMRLTLPVVADGLDNAVSDSFAAWPERIYIVDPDGRIAFAGGPGPWAFDPDAAGAALLQMLGTSD